MTDAREYIPLWEIPEVVIQGHLFPLLHLQDLFRLRRVSKDTKFLAEDYIRQHYGGKFPEIEIVQDTGSDNNRSLSSFLTLDMPVTRLYINNNNVAFYRDPDISQFLERYSTKITHLRVRTFKALSDSKERAFFDAFKNLIHLELEEIDAREWRCDYDRGAKKFGRTSCPIANSFYKLKTIKFGHILPSHNRDQGYWEDIVYCCYQNWEFIGHPNFTHPRPPNFISHSAPIPRRLRRENIPVPEFRNSGSFFAVHQLINYRHDNLHEEPNLQYYDMWNMNEGEVESANCMDFILLAQLCCDRGVKLLNVNAALFRLVGPEQEEFFNAMVAPIISLKNLDKSLFFHEMPNLEKVVITGTTKCSFFRLWDEIEGKPQWPRLKVLDMTVDSVMLKEYNHNQMRLTDLYSFLFTGVVRRELAELALRFEEVRNGPAFPSPKTSNIKMSCPNLKKLTLQNWRGTNKSLSLFWEGLTGLEELTLQDCTELGNVGFVGEDTANPTFFKLTKLKVLTLGGLERMPKVTGTAFDMVFKHMKLKKLFLTSRQPLKNLTPRGINTMLTGDFASTIEKFPFSDFSLEGVSAEELSELERKFRSYYMF